LLPKDLSLFAVRIRDRTDLVQTPLVEGGDLVEQVERLVCAIYDVPDDLADQIVAHAVRRAS
jgi:hypothetical protein